MAALDIPQASLTLTALLRPALGKALAKAEDLAFTNRANATVDLQSVIADA